MATTLLGTPARASAGHAAVTGSAAHHQRTADVTGGRVAHLDDAAERASRIFTLGNSQLNGHWIRPEQLALFASNEFQFKPAEDVINDGLRVADLGIAGPAAGLEASVRKFAT